MLLALSSKHILMVLLVLTRLLITVKTQLRNKIHVYFSLFLKWIYFVVFSILLLNSMILIQYYKGALKQTLLFIHFKSMYNFVYRCSQIDQ